LSHRREGVPALYAEVVVFQVDLEIRLDQLALDQAPHVPRDLVAVELDDRGLIFIFAIGVILACGACASPGPSGRPRP
jgi:hypothetical protein